MQLASSNPRVKRLRRLVGRRSARYEDRQFVVEGATLIDEALSAGWEVLEMFHREGATVSLRHDTRVDRFTLEPSVFDSIADAVTPQGVLAVVAIAAPAVDLTTCNFVIVVEGVADPGNLGTIIRSAEASGADAVVLIGDVVDPFSPKVVRASAGALFHVPVISCNDWSLVTESGLRVFGTTSHEVVGGTSTRSLYDCDMSGRIAVALGNEAHGLSDDAPVDAWITIPHVGRSESLNVAMAGTVVCMHVARGRTRSNDQDRTRREG